MPDNKKEQEREELHRAIWAIADDLRGSVDGWDFKSYVLGIMFYRYISENLTNYINADEIAAGNADFDYAKLSDEEAEQARDDLVQTKGFFILPSELFVNVRARAPQDDNLNMTMESVFRHIEDSAKGTESEDDFAGLFDDIDVNSNKLGATVAKRNAMLVKLLDGIGAMKLGECWLLIDTLLSSRPYSLARHQARVAGHGEIAPAERQVAERIAVQRICCIVWRAAAW